MPSVPNTTPVTIGASLTIHDLDSISLSNISGSGLPTIDPSSGSLSHSLTVDYNQWIDDTVGGVANEWQLVILAYLCDVWTETANRLTPGKDGATGTISGINPDVLSGKLA